MVGGDRPSVAFRTMPASDLPAALAIETASYPADEAATADLLRIVAHAGGAFVGMYDDSGEENLGRSGRTQDRSLGEETMSKHDASPLATTLCVHSVVVREDMRRRGLATRMLGGTCAMCRA